MQNYIFALICALLIVACENHKATQEIADALFEGDTNISSDVQRQLATVIVYGLLFSVIITLYVLPVFYCLMEKRFKDEK